jgi:hypothetical protein
VSKCIKKLLTSIIPEEHIWKIKLFQNWEKIIGSLKDKVTIEQIKEDILYLGVIHPAWAQELQMLTPILKEKINETLNCPKIKTIRFKLISPKKNIYINKHNNCIKNCLRSEICKKLSKNEQLVLDNVKDKELREVIHEFGLRCKNARSSKK